MLKNVIFRVIIGFLKLMFKGSMYFLSDKKHNVHRFTLNSHSLIVESFPGNITCWGAVVFEKQVKQCHENNLACKNVFL